MLSILIVIFEIPKKVQHAFSILDATALKCSAYNCQVKPNGYRSRKVYLCHMAAICILYRTVGPQMFTTDKLYRWSSSDPLHLIGHLRRSRQFAENWHLKKPTRKRRMALGSPLDLRDPRRTWGSLPAFLPIVGISHNLGDGVDSLDAKYDEVLHRIVATSFADRKFRSNRLRSERQSVHEIEGQLAISHQKSGPCAAPYLN